LAEAEYTFFINLDPPNSVRIVEVFPRCCIKGWLKYSAVLSKYFENSASGGGLLNDTYYH
jgi:hypothetical protein